MEKKDYQRRVWRRNTYINTHIPEYVGELRLFHNTHHQNINGTNDLRAVLQLGKPVVQDDVNEDMHHIPQHVSCCLGAQQLVVKDLGRKG